METEQRDGGVANTHVARKRRPFGKIALIVVGGVPAHLFRPSGRGLCTGICRLGGDAWGVGTAGLHGRLCPRDRGFYPRLCPHPGCGCNFRAPERYCVCLYCRHPGFLPGVSSCASSCSGGYRAEAGRYAPICRYRPGSERPGTKDRLFITPVSGFPFNLLNYALGLTKVRFVDYAIAAFGMLPGTVLYVYYGKLAGDVAALAGGAAPERGIADYGVLILGLVATVVVATIVTRTARSALREATGED